MKRVILFLVFILAIHFAYRANLILAASEEDATAIQKVIEKYLEGISKSDLDLVMSQLSLNYSGPGYRNIGVLDYAGVKSALAERIEMQKEHTKISISDLKITNLNIKDNKATLELEYILRTRRLDDTGISINERNTRSVSLAKENGSWKIIQIIFKNTEPVDPDTEDKF
jgi:hypothetical protein